MFEFVVCVCFNFLLLYHFLFCFFLRQTRLKLKTLSCYFLDVSVLHWRLSLKEQFVKFVFIPLSLSLFLCSRCVDKKWNAAFLRLFFNIYCTESSTFDSHGLFVWSFTTLCTFRFVLGRTHHNRSAITETKKKSFYEFYCNENVNHETNDISACLNVLKYLLKLHILNDF